jgi:hypothetical protein
VLTLDLGAYGTITVNAHEDPADEIEEFVHHLSRNGHVGTHELGLSSIDQAYTWFCTRRPCRRTVLRLPVSAFQRAPVYAHFTMNVAMWSVRVEAWEEPADVLDAFLQYVEGTAEVFEDPEGVGAALLGEICAKNRRSVRYDDAVRISVPCTRLQLTARHAREIAELLSRPPSSTLVRALNPDFALDEHYNNGSVRTLRHWRRVYMEDVQRPSLIKWNDKIWLHQWYEEHDISGPAVLHYSTDAPEVEAVLHAMKAPAHAAFVVKPSHLSGSRYIFKWVNGSTTDRMNVNRGAVPISSAAYTVDFNRNCRSTHGVFDAWVECEVFVGLDEVMRSAWQTRAEWEDWPRRQLAAGVVVERWVESDLEVGMHMIWGIPVAVVLHSPSGFEEPDERASLFDAPGKLSYALDASLRHVLFALDGTPTVNARSLPPWFASCLPVAAKVCDKARADYIRVDMVKDGERGCVVRELVSLLAPSPRPPEPQPFAHYTHRWYA